MNRFKSRKVTPWDGEENLTSTQAFLKKYYEAHYGERLDSLLNKETNPDHKICNLCYTKRYHLKCLKVKVS